MGAGTIECDVTFTRDGELVCRHAQCDLHATTNIVDTGLAGKRQVPPEFDPATGELTNTAEIKCCTSNITLAALKTLKGKMGSRYRNATSIAGVSTDDVWPQALNLDDVLYSGKGGLLNALSTARGETPFPKQNQVV